MTVRRASALAAFVATALAILPLGAPAAQASTSPVVISLGDSYISGEGGRWAGNTDGPYQAVDALGPTAYHDRAGGETYPGCSRARMSPIHFSTTVTSFNLACSGARTATYWDGRDFKPGLDFYDDGRGHRGQAALLRAAATGRNVKLIVVSISANDFRFGPVVVRCLQDFLLSSSLLPDYCHDDADVRKNITPAAVDRVRDSVVAGLRNVRTAMQQAGHRDGSYDVVMQLYPSPIPPGASFRYRQSLYSRYTTGGCPFWNRDADWFSSTYVPVINRTVREAVAESRLTDIHILDTAPAFAGHRLCEVPAAQLEETRLGSWRSIGAVDRLEWMGALHTVTVIGSPYRLPEGMHPNYWGQRALAACIGLAWNAGAVRGGTCTHRGPGLVYGKPVMQLR